MGKGKNAKLMTTARLFRKRSVSRVHLRILGYMVTLMLHIPNIIYMSSFHQGAVLEDPEIRKYIGLQYRFITCWNFGFQIIYAFIGLACDLLTLAHSTNKKYKLPSILSETRDTMFSAIIWPTSFQVATLFWPLYLYDTSLVYPNFIGRILTPLSNHIMHTAIVPIVVWEIMMRPQKEPQSHLKNVTILTVLTIVYWTVLFCTKFEQDCWVYPVFKYIEGTIYVPLLIYYSCITLCIHYKTQWIVVSYLYPMKKEKDDNKVK